MLDLPLKRATTSTRTEQPIKQPEPKTSSNPLPQIEKWNHTDQLDERSTVQTNPNVQNNRMQNKPFLNPEAPHFSFQQQSGAGESSFGRIYGQQSKSPVPFLDQNRIQSPSLIQQQQHFSQQQQFQHYQPEMQYMYHYDDQPQSDEADDEGGFNQPEDIERSMSGNMLPNFGVNSDIPRFLSANNMPDPSKQKVVAQLNKRAGNFSGNSDSSDGTSPNITPQQTQVELRSIGSMEKILFGDEKLPDDALESFKLEEYLGKLVEFSKTRNGSRILQKFFPRANQQEIDMVINEISGSLEEIMLDSYANYMFQTLAQSCSSEQRYLLLQRIAPLMPKVACDKKGTHSLQALISIINRDEEEKLIEENLRDYVVMLSKDPQGTHFIQKLVNSISIGRIDFIFYAVVQEFLDLANNSYGLCVLKALITKIQKQDDKKQLVIRLVSENVDNLIQNPYGNYAIQHTFETFKDDCYTIWEKIIDKVFQLSNQKFSSNVIERCLTTSNEENKKRFIFEVVKSERIVELMKNKYGNFVLLKIFNVSDEGDKARLVEAIQRYVNAINVSKYKTKWLTFLDENKAYLKNTSSKNMRYMPGNAFYSGNKNDAIGPNQVNQFPDTSGGGNSFKPSNGNFGGSQFPGFGQQMNYQNYNQFSNQGFNQQNASTGGFNPNQSSGFNPNSSQGSFNQGFNQSFKGNTYFQPQPSMTNPIPTSTKWQPSMGGMGNTQSFNEFSKGNQFSGYQPGGGYTYDNSNSQPWNGGFVQPNFPQNGTQGWKPMNYGGEKGPYGGTGGGYFEGPRKF